MVAENEDLLLDKKKYWMRWTLNCAVGELLGIGAAGAIAYYLLIVLGNPGDFTEKIAVLLAMMMAGAIEGGLLGYFQWRVLKDKFPNLPKREWMIYTIFAAVLGWFLGMLPSLFFISPDQVSSIDSTKNDFNQPFLFVIAIVGMGLLLGSLFGAFQWISLKKYADKANRWIPANALGWGLGLVWIFIFASLPNEASSIYFIIATGMAGGILAGVSVGATTGLFLVNLDRSDVLPKFIR